jgi:hypothetical protein
MTGTNPHGLLPAHACNNTVQYSKAMPVLDKGLSKNCLGG